jgi:hypothetical protein
MGEMLRLYKHEGGKFRQYKPSTQTHCIATDVEQWIHQSSGEDGVIHNVSVEIHDTSVPVWHAEQVTFVAALYAADHNDYVTRNLCYAVDRTPESDALVKTSASESGEESDEDAAVERCKLEEEFEQNETLTVHKFGPSHADDTDW